METRANAEPALIIDGRESASHTIVLAHGAGAGMETDFMSAFAQGLASGGLRVIRFEFPYKRCIRVDRVQLPPGGFFAYRSILSTANCALYNPWIRLHDSRNLSVASCPTWASYRRAFHLPAP